MLSSPYSPFVSKPLKRALKWGSDWSFISRGIRNTNSQIQKLKRPIINWIWIVKVWLPVFLMPLEIKYHAIPHLKALKSGLNISCGQWYGHTVYLLVCHKVAIIKVVENSIWVRPENPFVQKQSVQWPANRYFLVIREKKYHTALCEYGLVTKKRNKCGHTPQSESRCTP